MGSRAWHNWKRRLKLQGKHGVDDGSSWGTSAGGSSWDGGSDTWGESKKKTWHKSESFKERRERTQKKVAKPRIVKVKPSTEKLEKLKEIKKQKWKRSSKLLSDSGSGAVASPAVQDAAKSSAKTIRKRGLKTVDPNGRPKRKMKKKSVRSNEASDLVPISLESNPEIKQPQKKKMKKKKMKSNTVATEETSAATLAKADALLKARKLKVVKVKRKSKIVHKKKDSEVKAPEKTKATKVKSKRPIKILKWKQRASVILPGSVSERYSRGLTTSTCLHIPLTGEERALLAEGALSWRWLREADVPEETTEADPFGHGQILDTHASKDSKASLAKLHFFDECLERDALLPPCALRASIAAKLASRGAVRRRCMRQLEEVIMPLMTPSPTSDGKSDGDGPVNQLREEACALCQKCAQEWMSRGSASLHQEAVEAVRKAWLQMLCLSLQPEDQAQIPEGWHSLFRGFRCASLARFALQREKEGHPAMLRAVAAASAPENMPASPKLLVLPFGLFTGQQMLLLIAMARWSGAEAMVIRRTAAGAPDVIFRSAGVPRSD